MSNSIGVQNVNVDFCSQCSACHTAPDHVSHKFSLAMAQFENLNPYTRLSCMVPLRVDDLRRTLNISIDFFIPAIYAYWGC